MAISLVCPHCRKQIRAKDEHAGRRAKCPACKHELHIPGDRSVGHDVFITYASHDKATADAVCHSLEVNGIGCWIAPRDILPGVEWGKGIIDGINGSRVMVLVYSSSSNDSPQVMRELERAVNKRIPILPLRIEDVPPSASMEYFISAQHWLDALAPPLEQYLDPLVRVVESLLGRSADQRVVTAELVSPPPPTDRSKTTPEGLAGAGGSVTDVKQPMAIKVLVAVCAGLTLFVLLLVLVIAAVVDNAPPSTPPSVVAVPSGIDLHAAMDAEEVPIFNGEDLSDWMVLEARVGLRSITEPAFEDIQLVKRPDTEGWKPQHGVLLCEGFENRCLAYNQVLDDFDVSMEIRLPPEPYRGLFQIIFRTDLSEGTEGRTLGFLQTRLHDQQEYNRLSPTWKSGGIHATVAPAAPALLPQGQWNRLRICCVGNRVQIALNGIRTVDTSFSEIPPELADRIPVSGLFGFFGYESSKGVQIRNIRLRKL